MINKLERVNSLILSNAMDDEQKFFAVKNELRNVFCSEEVNYYDEAIIRRKSTNVYLPIVLNNKIIGYYEIVNPKYFLERDVIGTLIASLTSMHNDFNEHYLKFFRENVDEVTGLYNKNYLFTYGQDMLNQGQYASALLIEIKGVHNYNFEDKKDKVMLLLEFLKQSYNDKFSYFFRYDNKLLVLSLNKDYLYAEDVASNIQDILAYQNVMISYGFCNFYCPVDLGYLMNYIENDFEEKNNVFFNSPSHELSKK